MAKDPLELLKFQLPLEPEAGPVPSGTRVFREQTSATVANEPPVADTVVDPLIDAELDGYRVLEYLRGGTQGHVYRGVRSSDNAPCIVKLLKPELARDEDLRRRFLREARALAAFEWHPNVVRMYACGETASGRPYLVLDYLEGVTLDEWIRSNGPIAFERILVWGTQLAGALRAIHHAGLAHRDLKPANIMVDPAANRVTLVDFGLVSQLQPDETRLTFAGERIGTPGFIAPEVVAPHDDPAPVDCWALGQVLRCMATGTRAPDDPILAALDEPLTALVARLLESDPARRATATETEAALLELANPPRTPWASVLLAALGASVAIIVAIVVMTDQPRSKLVVLETPTPTPTPLVEIVQRAEVPPTRDEPVEVQPPASKARRRRRRPPTPATSAAALESRSAVTRALTGRNLRMADVRHLESTRAYEAAGPATLAGASAALVRSIETLVIDARIVSTRLDRVVRKLRRLGGRGDPQLELDYLDLRRQVVDDPAVPADQRMRDLELLERRVDRALAAL